MLFHAVFFPMMIVTRVRDVGADVAITPVQLTNLHYISDFFGLTFCGIAITSLVMQKAGIAAGKNVLYTYRLKTSLDRTLRELAEFQPKHEVPRSSENLKGILGKINAIYFCEAITFAEDGGILLSDRLMKFLALIKPCEQLTAIAENKSPTADTGKRPATVLEDMTVTVDKQEQELIKQIFLSPELRRKIMSGDRFANDEVWGLAAAGYFGSIYNVIDMVNAMNANNRIVQGNSFGGVFVALLLFLFTRVLPWMKEPWYDPNETERNKAHEKTISNACNEPSQLDVDSKACAIEACKSQSVFKCAGLEPTTVPV